MLIPSLVESAFDWFTSLSRRVNANSQPASHCNELSTKLIKKGEC